MLARPAVMMRMLHLSITTHIGHQPVFLESLAVSALPVHSIYVPGQREGAKQQRARSCYRQF
jgi:hypothetical protein